MEDRHRFVIIAVSDKLLRNFLHTGREVSGDAEFSYQPIRKTQQRTDSQHAYRACGDRSDSSALSGIFQ